MGERTSRIYFDRFYHLRVDLGWRDERESWWKDKRDNDLRIDRRKKKERKKGEETLKSEPKATLVVYIKLKGVFSH